MFFFFFFFQAEDGIRDWSVTGVQTCALPISSASSGVLAARMWKESSPMPRLDVSARQTTSQLVRSEEHTSELQSLTNLVCRLLLEKKKTHDSPPATAQNRITPTPWNHPFPNC